MQQCAMERSKVVGQRKGSGIGDNPSVFCEGAVVGTSESRVNYVVDSNYV